MRPEVQVFPKSTTPYRQDQKLQIVSQGQTALSSILLSAALSSRVEEKLIDCQM
jgi:hypothetical protein